MLPDFLQSSYQVYKGDIDVLAKWLVVKAKQCGYPADLLSSSDPPTLPPSQKRKGAARKIAKNQSKENAPPPKDPNSLSNVLKYTIKVKDFAVLAEYIAQFSKPAVQVPAHVVEVLNRVIDLRQQLDFWFRAQVASPASVGVDESNQNHDPSLDILEHTRETLKPGMPPGILDDLLLKSSSRLSDQGKPDTQANGVLSNMFDNLDIQEPSLTFLDALDVKPAIDIRAVQEPDYEVEQLQGIEEQDIASHCLFQDVTNIRSFLRQLWASYRDGDLALVAASITTNAAIDFVRGLEQDFLQRFPDKHGFQGIMHLFYIAQCLDRGQDPSIRQRPKDSFNFEVYDLAEELMVPTYAVLEAIQGATTPNEIPIYESAYLGARDMTTNWTEKSDREKFRDDQIVLMQAIPDLMLMAIVTSRFVLAEDELIRGIRQLAPGNIIPLWLVFAVQCFLDTQHVLGQDVGRGHTELQRTGNAIKVSITQNLKFHQSLRIETWPWQNDARLSATIAEIEKWIRQDLVAVTLGGLPAAEAVPPPEPFRLLKQYPLLCGLLSFAIQMNAHGMGIDFANAWGSITCASHLYNATRQEKLLSKPWKDLELLLALQSREQLFIGNTPKDLDAYFRRFVLSTGYSSTRFASNRRENAPARGPRGLSESCNVGGLFAGRYCRNEYSVSWTTESMQPIIEANLEDDSDNEGPKRILSSKVKTAVSGSFIRWFKRSGKSIPTTDFLQDIAHALHAETLELSVDYLRLHRSCWMLLRKVHEACESQLLESIGAGYMIHENQLPFMVGYIFMVATETNGVTNLFLPRRPGTQVSTRLLAQAAKALEDMVDSGVGEIEIKFIKQRSGIGEIDFEQLDCLDV